MVVVVVHRWEVHVDDQRAARDTLAMFSQCEIRSRLAPLTDLAVCTFSTPIPPAADVGAVRPHVHALWPFNVDASPRLVLDRSARAWLGTALRIDRELTVWHAPVAGAA